MILKENQCENMKRENIMTKMKKWREKVMSKMTNERNEENMKEEENDNVNISLLINEESEYQ